MERIVREVECRLLTGLSRSTRWRLEREGKFPPRRKISEQASGWLDSELSEWISTRPITKTGAGEGGDAA